MKIKEEIIKKFGMPVSTSFETENDITKEDLHFLETFGDINIVTTITLQNGTAIKQNVDKITSNYDERFKKIERNIKILQSPRLYN